MLLHEEFEQAFASETEPEARPIEDRLLAGRRAVRRRRVVGVVGAAAAVAVIGGVGALTLPGSGSTEPAPAAPIGSAKDPAKTPSATATPSTQAPPQVQRRQGPGDKGLNIDNDYPVALSDGVLVVKRGWRVTRIVDNPSKLLPPDTSFGVIVESDDSARWMLLEEEAEGGYATYDDPETVSYSRFDDWLRSIVAINRPEAVEPLVTRDRSGSLAPGQGATILAQRSAAPVAPYADAEDLLVKVERDGRTWFVVVRGRGENAEVIPVDADALSAPTFEAFIDHVRAQDESNEGLR